MRRALVAAGAGAAVWAAHGVFLASAPPSLLGRVWTAYWVYGSLALALLAVALVAWRTKIAESKVALALALLVLPCGLLVRFLSGWQAYFLYPESCRAPLEEPYVCTGFDESFQESYAGRLARGRPNETECRAFALKAACTETPGSWERVACRDLALPNDWACFACDRQYSYEESSSKLFAFAPDCRSAVWFHGENVGRDTAVAWIRDGRLN